MVGGTSIPLLSVERGAVEDRTLECRVRHGCFGFWFLDLVREACVVCRAPPGYIKARLRVWRTSGVLFPPARESEKKSDNGFPISLPSIYLSVSVCVCVCVSVPHFFASLRLSITVHRTYTYLIFELPTYNLTLPTL